MSGYLPFDLMTNDIKDKRRLKVETDNQRTAFGEDIVAQKTPIVQLMGRNGIRDDVITTFSGAGASATTEDYQYKLESGATPNGVASVISVLKGSYKAGQGLEAELSAVFSDGAVNSVQLAGFISSEDSYSFGFLGDVFGIHRIVYGSTEIQTLTVTAGASGNESASVTINNTVYSIPLTSGSDIDTASEIGDYFRTNPIPNWTVTSNGSKVIALSAVPVPSGSFSFSSATAVASWFQDRAGDFADFASHFVPISSWGNPPTWGLDPTKGNVYKIVLPYLGYDGPLFYIKNPVTGSFELVHYIKYLNTSTVPHCSNPSFSVGWAIQNFGNTTNLIVKGASAAIFNQGKILIDEPNRALSNTNLCTSAEQHVLSIRNRSVLANSINANDIYSMVGFFGNNDNREVIFRLRINADFDQPLDWSYIDEQSSIAETAINAGVIVSGGREIGDILVERQSASGSVPLIDMISKLTPRQTLTVSAFALSGGGDEMTASINFKEDL